MTREERTKAAQDWERQKVKEDEDEIKQIEQAESRNEEIKKFNATKWWWYDRRSLEDVPKRGARREDNYGYGKYGEPTNEYY